MYNILSVGTEKLIGIELRLQCVHRHGHSRRRAIVEMQMGDFVFGIHMIYITHKHLLVAVAPWQQEAFAVTETAAVHLLEQLAQAVAVVAGNRLHSLGSVDGCSKFLAVNRFKQIVDTVILECTYGIFVVCRGEDNG